MRDRDEPESPNEGTFQMYDILESLNQRIRDRVKHV